MPQLLFIALSLILGLILGSFATVHVVRYGREDMNPARPLRSECMACGKKLTWSENVPVLSWLLQGGKCRGCGAPISARYPLIEIITGGWCAGLALVYGPSVEWGVYLAFGWLFIVLSFIDFEHYLLPDVYTLPGAVLALACSALLLNQGGAWDRLAPGVWGMVVGAGGFYVLHLAYRLLRGVEGMGLGDVKLMLVIGGLLGVQSLPFILLSGSVAALGAGLWYRARPGADGMNTPVPYGPFLSFGAMLWILVGHQWWTWYLVQFNG